MMSIKNMSLAYAVENNDLNSIKKLLALHRVDVNGKDDGKSSLFIAVEKGFFEIAQQLINHGAYLDLTCNSGPRDGHTALHVAVEDRNRKIIKLLLESGASVNLKNKCGDTPFLCLFLADTLNDIDDKKTHLLEEDKDIGLLLLNHGADIYAVNMLKQTVFHLAAKNGSVMILEYLLQNNFDVNVKDCFGYTLFHWLLCPNFILREKEVWLSGNKCKEIAELLISKGADVHATTKRGENLLHLASVTGHVEVVKLLLKCGSDVTSRDSNDHTPLHLAIKRKHVEIVKLLLQYNVDVNYKNIYGLTPLYYTCYTNIKRDFSGTICRQIAELLINKGADIHAITNTGETLLHLAARNGCVEIVKLLIKYGANVRVTDSMGLQPIFIAAKLGHLSVVKLLVKAGVDVNDITMDTNLGLLHIAAKAGRESVIKYLVHAGANINVPAFEVGTPLQYAIEYNNVNGFSNNRIDAIDALLECGADINLKNEKNKTPFHYALCVHRNDNLIKVFVKHIVKLRSQHMYVSRDNYQSLYSHPRINYSFLKECEKEIKKMKAKQVNHNTKIKYFDIFTKSIHTLTKYANNKDIVRSFEWKKVSTEFPVYANIICSQLWQGIERRVLVDKCIKVFYYVSKLPIYCSENICFYLGETDLENLISACPIHFKQEFCNSEEKKVGRPIKRESELLDVFENTKKHKFF